MSKSIIGKTYSLLDNSSSSKKYYETVSWITEFLLKEFYIDESQLLKIIKSDSRKGYFGKSCKEIKFIKNRLKSDFSKYTQGVKQHLKRISVFQQFDATLRTKEEQYHLYMIEIELVNRIYKNHFLKSDFKMALLPHCLSDFRPRCLSKGGEIEHVCMGCTKDCYIHLGSKLLRGYKIAPYISVAMDQRKLLKLMKMQHPNIGVLGIACIPELARGMRLCQSLDIPAIGIPLDANRCARWMGEAYETSFNLQELERLIK